MRKSVVAVLVLLILVLCVPACLDTKRQLGLRYDPSKDEFHVLRVYYHIHAETDAEVKYLAELYANRDHLILYDPVAIFKENAALRLQDGKYRDISLGEPATAAPEPETIDLDLKSIQIEPGKFFASADNTACYYQQFTVPGALIDKLLGKANVAMQKALGDQVASELERRAGGGAAQTMADLRKALLYQLDKMAAGEAATEPAGGAADAVGTAGTAPATQPGSEFADNPLMYLSTDSLKLLQQSCKDGTLALTRKGAVTSLAAHLSPDDANALQATLAELKLKFPAVLAKQTDADKKKQGSAALQLANLFTITPAVDGQFSIAIDTVKFVETVSTVMDVEAIDKAKADGYARVVDGLKAAGVAMDPNLKLEQIIPDFEKGTLPVDPPAHSVIPGTGIYNDPAATMPGQPGPA